MRSLVLSVCLALPSVALADEASDCVKKKKLPTCVALSEKFHAKHPYKKISPIDEMEYAEFVDSVDITACELGSSTHCDFITELHGKSSVIPEVADLIRRAQLAKCGESTSAECEDIRVKLGVTLKSERACLDTKAMEACTTALKPMLSAHRNVAKDAPERQAIAARTVAVARILCDGGDRDGCDAEAELLRKDEAQKVRYLEVNKKLCAMKDSSSCSTAKALEKELNPPPPAENPNLAPCLVGSDANLCVFPAMDESIRASQFKSALPTKPRFKADYLESLRTVLKMSARACALKDDRGCGVLNRGLNLVDVEDDAQRAHAFASTSELCQAGVKDFCPVAERFKPKGASKPVEAKGQSDDVAATLALLKKNGSLKGADLKGKKLEGISLKGANLSGANLTGAILIGADLSNANLDGATLDEAKLTEAGVYDASLVGASAKHATFTNANGSFKTVRDSHLERALITTALDATEVKGAFLDDAIFENCNLTKRDLRGASFRGTSFVDCNLTGANLSGVNLKGATLEKAKLDETNFEGATLEKAKLGGVTFDKTVLTKANLQGADVSSALFMSLKLRDTDFRGANLRDTKFGTGVDVSGTNFDGATICGTSLEKVKGWSSASSKGAKLVCE